MVWMLSKSLTGHTQDVRALTVHKETIYSASRDGSVIAWNTKDGRQEGVYVTHRGFVNSVAFIEPFIVSGGQDAAINLTRTGASNADFALLGHSANVCALAVSSSGQIVSGSWDGTCKVWKDGSLKHTLEGHDGAVWAVLPTSHGILTGGADKTIRLWKEDRQIKNMPAGKDCIRALALHPLGFISAGNDAIVRIHTFDGEVVQTLEGHDSFIYSLAVLPTGEIASVGEDRTLRIWKDGALQQTIRHPAVSVWSVAVTHEGDIVTGASDAVVRVFTQSQDRKASSQEVTAFEKTVAASAVPAQAPVIPNNLPGLEALGSPGNKDGVVKMIRLSGSIVEAHQWSGGVWTKIGEVVGASPKKVAYQGTEYDFVFDVDIAEGAPPLKLPYNTDQNPYEAAQMFIERNELQPEYRDQIVKFIEQNTGGIVLGVPKTGPSDVPAPQPSANALTPQRSYLEMTAGNLVPVLDRVRAIATFYPDLDASCLSGYAPATMTTAQWDLVLALLRIASPDQRFPVLDLLRSSLPFVPPDIDLVPVIELVLQKGDFDGEIAAKSTRTNRMLAMRCLANLFIPQCGVSCLEGEEEKIMETVGQVQDYSYAGLDTANATLLLNFSVLAYKKQSAVSAINILEPLLRLTRESSSPEAIFRALIALGTLLRISEEVKEAAAQVFDAQKVVEAVNLPEERIQSIRKEITHLLSG